MPHLEGLAPFLDDDRTLLRVLVETPAGGQNKYDHDPDTGLLTLDRPLHSALRYPFDYGFVPSTEAEDGDPLDVVLVIPEPTFPGCLVEAHVIAVMLMEDEDGPDPKLICRARKDPRTAQLHDLGDLPPHFLDECAHFFTRVKDLESGKWARVDGFADRGVALAQARDAADRFSSGGAA